MFIIKKLKIDNNKDISISNGNNKLLTKYNLNI